MLKISFYCTTWKYTGRINTRTDNIIKSTNIAQITMVVFSTNFPFSNIFDIFLSKNLA